MAAVAADSRAHSPYQPQSGPSNGSLLVFARQDQTRRDGTGLDFPINHMWVSQTTDIYNTNRPDLKYKPPSCLIDTRLSSPKTSPNPPLLPQISNFTSSIPTMPSSPTKQRAALAPLDANAKPSLPSPKMSKDGTTPIIPLTGGSSPLKKSFSPSVTSGTKRSAEAMTSPGTKKPCIQENTRSRTTSPASPSLFDTSTEGDSWATTTTEPEIGIVSDAPALLAPRQRGSLTREQAREKAEILRLRLGLASYKVRTGQTTVPLADLQRKPLPRKTVRVQSPREDASQSWRRSNSPASVSGLVGLAMGDS